MFSRSAELYDIIYSTIRDYEADSRRIQDAVASRHATAKRILDVACGTGEHARHLERIFGYQVDGLDLDENLLAIARRKNPRGRFTQGDMADFDLGETYDVVLCLFSSIGYARTLDRVASALNCFRKHLRPDGIALVEPWFAPGALDPGRVFVNVAEGDGVKVVRMAVTRVEGRRSFTRFEYLIGSEGTIRHESEIHELGLFTVEEMMDGFRVAGLEVEHDTKGLSGRGLYAARLASEP